MDPSIGNEEQASISPQLVEPQIPSVVPIPEVSKKSPGIAIWASFIILGLFLFGVGGYLIGRKHEAQLQKQKMPVATRTENNSYMKKTALPIATITSKPTLPVLGQDTWLTYSSTSASFTFKYPDGGDWRTMNPTDINIGTVTCFRCTNNENVTTFRVWKTEYMTAEEYLAGQWAGTEVSHEQSVFNGLPATMIAIPFEGRNISEMNIYFHYMDVPYVISIQYEGGEYKTISEFPKARPDILSTFRLE